MKREHGIKITRQQMNEMKRKTPKKVSKPFIEGANVKVPNLDKPFFSHCEGEVVSYDSIRKTYHIKLDNGSIVVYPESHVKGWWEQ